MINRVTRNKVFLILVCFLLLLPSIAVAYPKGDTHLHSNWSADSPGFGPNYYATKYESKGFDYIVFSEHSDVLFATPLSSTLNIMSSPKYRDYVNEIEDLDSGYPDLAIIPGIELTMGNGYNWETSGHFITLTDAGYIHPFVSANFDKPKESVRHSTTYLLDKYYSAGGEFGIVAHPVKYGDPWDFNDYGSVFRTYSGKIGMELISMGKRQPARAIRIWDTELSAGRRVTGVAGSDTHSFQRSLIGSAKSILLIDENGLTKENVINAFRQGKVIASNGPFVNFSVAGTNGSAGVGGELEVARGETVMVKVDYKVDENSNIYVYDAKGANRAEPVHIQAVSKGEGTVFFDYAVENSTYLRLELVDSELVGADKVALTNPVWLTIADKSFNSLDVALIIDSSGSMSTNDRNNERKTQAKRFVDMMQVGDRCTVIDFDGYAKVLSPLTEILGDQERELLKKAIDNIDSWGGTNLGAGLVAGYDELYSSPDQDQKKTVIFLTDGEGSYRNEASLFAEQGWPIYTISLGTYTNTTLLRQIAEETAGKFYSALTADTLDEIYRDLVKEVRGQSEIGMDTIYILPLQIINHFINIAGETLEATFNIDWSGSTVGLTLITPSGEEITPTTEDLNVSYTDGPTYASYRVKNPEPGMWTMTLEGIDVPIEGEPVEITVNGLLQTPPNVTFTEGADLSTVSGEVYLSAVAEDNEEILDFVLYMNGEPVAISADKANIEYVWDTTQYEDGKYIIAADAMDELFALGTAEVSVIVDNSDPTADAGPEVTGKVGEPVFFDASNSVGVSMYGYAWDFGDGNVQEFGREGAIHEYNAPGTYTVTLAVYDDMGKIALDKTTAYISASDNTLPVVQNINISPNPAPVVQAITLTALIDDRETGGSNIASAEYSLDGGKTWIAMQTVDDEFDSPLEGYSATIGHFSEPGVYDVLVRGTDAAGNVSEPQSILLAIYDPSAGFVTGGGWIWSPIGAYAVNPELEGKATFAFVSRYQKGAKVPSGNTQFQFKAGDLNFSSNEYEWLVISGARAQYKGSGTINGTGNYGFILSAIDGDLLGRGQPDRFRIKIWDKATGAVVYDNQMGKSDTGDDATVLGGGSIVIHK